MNLQELKTAAECRRTIFDPATILKLIAVVEAANLALELEYWDGQLNVLRDPLRNLKS